VCPVESAVRSGLRRYDASRITGVYSEARPIPADAGRDGHGKSVIGSMPTIPAIFGMTLASEAIGHILGNGVRRA
ncbi:MAG: tRNA threonylcarbamoyladenosine dehydratase, partial [Candidatus Methanomethylophilaceae archaeon]|nr:tRNA threonylcarbamoyladenosine dehydratase [Candidatus Methanomethylophilaceae archaeon]